jgi:prepilin signal peptidase PulO-like enzyme (type II secretory pathway)
VDTVPIVSWIALRGRCHACGARISVAYPLTELATAGLFVAAALVFEDLWETALLAPFLGLLFALSVIDIRHHKIPNRLVYPAILLSASWVVVADLAGSELSAPSAGIGFLAYGVGLLIVALISPWRQVWGSCSEELGRSSPSLPAPAGRRRSRSGRTWRRAQPWRRSSAGRSPTHT